MIRFSFALLVVVCLAGELVHAIGGVKGSKSKKPTGEPDFRGLDEYFAKSSQKLRSKSLEQLKYDIRRLKGDVRTAGELVLALMHVKECDNQALDILGRIKAAGLTTSSYRLTEYTIRVPLMEVIKSCEEYVEQSVRSRFNESSSDADFARFMEVLSPAYLTKHNLATRTKSGALAFGQDAVKSYPYQIFNGIQWARILKELANKEIVLNLDQQQKEKLFEKYLLGPCDHFLSTFGNLFYGAKYAASINFGKYDFKELKKYDNQFKSLAFTHLACESIRHINSIEKGNLFQHL